jgi:hypothetical protein
MKASEWAGCKVKSRVPLRNGRMSLPAGTIFTVEEKYGGLKLCSEECPHCGAKQFITRVSISDVELLPEEA